MFWHQHKVASNAAVVCEIKIALQQFYLLSTQSHKYELKVNFYHSIVCAISVQCNCQLNWFILSTTMIHFNHQFMFCENEREEKFQVSSNDDSRVVLSSENVGVFCLPNSTESEKNFYVIRDRKALESVQNYRLVMTS
jgi:hypothetical protein